MTKTLLTSPFLWTFWLCNYIGGFKGVGREHSINNLPSHITHTCIKALHSCGL